MKMKIAEEWCMRLAQLEGDAEIGAGRLAIDPAGETGSIAAGEWPSIAFGRFVSLVGVGSASRSSPTMRTWT